MSDEPTDLILFIDIRTKGAIAGGPDCTAAIQAALDEARAQNCAVGIDFRSEVWSTVYSPFRRGKYSR